MEVKRVSATDSRFGQVSPHMRNCKIDTLNLY